MTVTPTAKHRRSVRLDLSPIRADDTRTAKVSRMVATPKHVTPEGFRFYEGTAAFGNIVQAYPDMVPPRAEFRPWSEVKDPESVASLRGRPIVGTSYANPVGHPGSDVAPPGRLLTADDVKTHYEGTVLDAWPDEATKSLRFEIVVHTAALCQAIDDGTVEVSLAYDPEEDETPGVFEGQRYDVVQRRIRYNAASVVDRARAERPTGEVARLDQAPETPMDPEIAKMLTLSPAAMALVEQMAGPDKDLVMKAMASLAEETAEAAAAGEAEGESMMGDAASGTGAGGDLPPAAPKPTPEGGIEMDAAPVCDAEAEAKKTDMTPSGAGSATMDEKTVSKMISDAMAPVLDALGKMKPGASPAPAPSGSGGRSDAAPLLDASAVIAQATAEAAKAGAKAGHAAHEADAALVKQVRMDGHPDVYTAQDAAARMLVTVKDHLPLLAPDAEAHLKAGRMDAFGGLYRQASALKKANDGRLDADMRHAVLGSNSIDPLEGAGNSAYTYVPSRPGIA